MPEAPLLAAAGLAKTWPNGLAGLAAIELELHASEVTVMVGPNGAGKTTLLRILAGFESADSGAELSWQGERRSALQPGREVSLLAQRPYTLKTSVRKNLDYPLRCRGEDLAAADLLLEQAKLSELAARHAHRASGGERQRLALACVLATKAPLLLLDEPTASLDAPNRKLATEMIHAAAAAGKAVLAAFPDDELPEELSDCRRIAITPAKTL